MGLLIEGFTNRHWLSTLIPTSASHPDVIRVMFFYIIKWLRPCITPSRAPFYCNLQSLFFIQQRNFIGLKRLATLFNKAIGATPTNSNKSFRNHVGCTSKQRYHHENRENAEYWSFHLFFPEKLIRNFGRLFCALVIHRDNPMDTGITAKVLGTSPF